MSGLVLKFRPGEALIINGAAIRFRTASEIVLPSKADILFGKQIMPPSDATTPARRLYFAIQNAYITRDEERGAWLAKAFALHRDLRDALSHPKQLETLSIIEQALHDRAFHRALKACLSVMDYERALLGEVPVERGSVSSRTQRTPRAMGPAKGDRK